MSLFLVLDKPRRPPARDIRGQVHDQWEQEERKSDKDGGGVSEEYKQGKEAGRKRFGTTRVEIACEGEGRKGRVIEVAGVQKGVVVEGALADLSDIWSGIGR